MDQTTTSTTTAVQLAEQAIRDDWREANGCPPGVEVLPPAGTLHHYECAADGQWYYRVACADGYWREVPAELASIAGTLLTAQGPTPEPIYAR